MTPPLDLLLDFNGCRIALDSNDATDLSGFVYILCRYYDLTQADLPTAYNKIHRNVSFSRQPLCLL